MRPIDFFLIGAQKSGTSSLSSWLAQHPEISMSRLKENAWFGEDHLYHQGEAWLENSYRGAEDRRVWGIAYVHMIQSPVALERVERHNPNAKIVAVLRNPIDRAHSAYWFARRSGWEPCVSFEEAIAREASRREGTLIERRELAYLGNGDYAAQLAPWIERFGRDRVHVVITDDLHARSREALAGTLAFLGLDPASAAGIDTEARQNESAWPRIPLLHHALMSRDGLHKRIGRTLIPAGLRVGMWERVLYPATRWNLEPVKYPKMSPATRERLAAELAPKNARLGALIGRDLSAWK